MAKVVSLAAHKAAKKRPDGLFVARLERILQEDRNILDRLDKNDSGPKDAA